MVAGKDVSRMCSLTIECVLLEVEIVVAGKDGETSVCVCVCVCVLVSHRVRGCVGGDAGGWYEWVCAA